MQLTKGYFVISRLVHRLGRAQSYRGGGGKGKVCKQQEGYGLQPPPNPAIFYPQLLLPQRACQGWTLAKTTSHCVLVSKAPLEAPAPLHSLKKHFLVTSQVYNTVLGTTMMQEDWWQSSVEENSPSMCKVLGCSTHKITVARDTQKRTQIIIFRWCQ